MSGRLGTGEGPFSLSAEHGSCCWRAAHVQRPWGGAGRREERRGSCAQAQSVRQRRPVLGGLSVWRRRTCACTPSLRQVLEQTSLRDGGARSSQHGVRTSRGTWETSSPPAVNALHARQSPALTPMVSLGHRRETRGPERAGQLPKATQLGLAERHLNSSSLSARGTLLAPARHAGQAAVGR